MAGQLELIWIKRKRRGSMEVVPSVVAVAGSGLAGNVEQGGRRQITLLSAEAWDAVQEELSVSLDPTLRRANLMVNGVDLEASRGKTLFVGDVKILIHGETRPCSLMDKARTGLRKALSPNWRGGAYGEILTGGELRVGDPVGWIDEE